MNRRRPPFRLALPVALLALGACSGDPADPELPGELTFSDVTVELGRERTGLVEIRNTGGVAVGPVVLQAGPVLGVGGASVPGTLLRTDPAEIPTLNPGDGATVSLEMVVGSTLNPGRYDVSLEASGGPGVKAVLGVGFEVEASEGAEGLRILVDDMTVRTGDVVALPVEVRAGDGRVLEGATVAWRLDPAGAGFVTGDGRFVGYAAGAATLVATSGAFADTVVLDVRTRALSGSFSRVGAGVETLRYTSDLWLHGDYAYVGSWSVRPGPQGQIPGNQLAAWRISDPAAPTKVGTVTVDARTVNDVKVRADGALGLITHEGSADGLNGVSLLDLGSPSRPTVIGRYTENLNSGVHNAWLDGDYAYLVVDGPGSGLRILDVSDPSSPEAVAFFYAGTSFLHDVYVRDGLAFLSHWNAGLVILDVGHGVAGGSPTNPVEVARLEDLGGQTHNAWYWPEAGYVFVGEEDFGSPGFMHVVDVRDLRRPREVATFRVPGQTPHNFWLDETTGVLYLAWYAQGLRALDVTGELLGELDRQGREIASTLYNDTSVGCDRPSAVTCTWAPQLHRGLVWVSDMNQGLVALRPPA